jgi:prepilin-type N-terminal cleavage/methylation domain-containing protein
MWKDRLGYTLPEVITAVAIAGVLAAISLIILLALLERWRVEAAADQLAADIAVERYAPPGPLDTTEGGLGVSVRTAFVDDDLSDPTDSRPTGQMRVEVSVTWEASTYSTVGVVSGEPP